uniref:Uncharacterized protein n=1 Tax=Rhizophora mucronata TaxID=61149 RepID=A0A2P2R420_RHIMU
MIANANINSAYSISALTSCSTLPHLPHLSILNKTR